MPFPDRNYIFFKSENQVPCFYTCKTFELLVFLRGALNKLYNSEARIPWLTTSDVSLMFYHYVQEVLTNLNVVRSTPAKQTSDLSQLSVKQLQLSEKIKSYLKAEN